MTTSEGYDIDGCVRLVAAVIRQEIRDAYGDPARLRPIADELGVPYEELLRRWAGRKRSHSYTYGIKRSDFNGQR